MSTLHKRGYRPKPGERTLSYFDDHEDRWYSPRDGWVELWTWARSASEIPSLLGWLAKSEVAGDELVNECIEARDAIDPLVLRNLVRVCDGYRRRQNTPRTDPLAKP